MTVTLEAPADRSAPGARAHEQGAPADRAVTGRVHSWDLSTGVDGPGTRFVVFTSGCLMRCLYCANPDTWARKGGTEMTVDELMVKVRRFAPALRVSGGGVTVSGGEPLLQPAFTGALLRACREEGLHTALDTAGMLGQNASDEMLDDVSLVLLDIKSFRPDLYKRLTAQKLEPTLRFARRLADANRPTWIRFVLVPGVTDDPENVAGLADFVAGLGNVERVDVLAYHRMGVQKYEALQLPYPLDGVPAPTEEQLARARAEFAQRGLKVT
jgi:pyruvate formate lyase activating enzyme